MGQTDYAELMGCNWFHLFEIWFVKKKKKEKKSVSFPVDTSVSILPKRFFFSHLVYFNLIIFIPILLLVTDTFVS